jgi:SAM-dependent methyltransferase
VLDLELVHVLYRHLGTRFRRKRMELFVRTFRPGENTTILDVGGRQGIWEKRHLRVTILNTEASGTFDPDFGMAWVVGDACSMPFGDGSFDVAFSNSLIEHLGGSEQRQRFAAEVRRVGRGYWVQTPSRTFPVEPHFLAPLFHWMPRRLQRRLLVFTPWALLTGASRAYAEQVHDGIELVGCHELQQLFPDGIIVKEKVLGMTKSYIAVGLSRAEDQCWGGVVTGDQGDPISTR